MYVIKQQVMIHSFREYNYKQIHPKDETGRDIGYATLENVLTTGRNSMYPNILFMQKSQVISPYEEAIMSLGIDNFYENGYEATEDMNRTNTIKKGNFFFFMYHFDNYFHFIYDTLPYLYTFFELKKDIPEMKLLVAKSPFYRFNEEILSKLVGSDWVFHEKDSAYERVYISSSLTHGGLSNNPPRNEASIVYDRMLKKIDYSMVSKKYRELEKIYISRRTWIKEKSDNIGTDYTNRRKMLNEDAIVHLLEKKGYSEIFSEDLNIDEKLHLFSKAKNIVGVIGGGMVNLVFTQTFTKSFVIVSPRFLDINARFRFCTGKSKVYYFQDTCHAPFHKIPLYTRARIEDETSKYHGLYGEIFSFKDGLFGIHLSNNDVSGFSSDNKGFVEMWFREDQLVPLDWGLNSPYLVDYTQFENKIVD